MIVRYDFAPLDGITKVVFRRVHHRMFGGPDRYFIPFFSPPDQHILTQRDRRELESFYKTLGTLSENFERLAKELAAGEK